MSFFKKTSIFFSTFLLFAFPFFAEAQSVSLTTSKASLSIGESALITVSVQTGGQQINTLGGQVIFDPSKVVISDVRFGNSVISLWVEKPVASSNGTINFTGGVPGGFSGNSGTIFSFVVKPKGEGSTNLSLKDVHVLLNDGSGGEMQGLKLIPVTLNITKAKPPAPSPVGTPKEEKPLTPSVIPKDTVPPENFIPMIGRHESVAENAYFVSFFAVDKDSGVAKYEVREIKKFLGSETPWVESGSPYILKTQRWGTKVEVKAIDGAGNSVVASVDKPFSTSIMWILVLLLLVLTVLVTRYITKKASKRRR